MSANAVVQIKGLKISAIIGTQPHERELPQELLADVFFEYDASMAADTDVLMYAVDYAAIHARIVEKVPGTKFFLLERLASFILALIMEDTKIVSAKVSLEKSGVLSGAKSVILSMSAQRAGKTINTTRCY